MPTDPSRRGPIFAVPDMARSLRHPVQGRGGGALTHSLLELDGHTILVTDPDRRVFGDHGPTKLEIVAYYLRVAPRLVSFLRGRSVCTVLLPDQSTREFRFARTASPGWPCRFPTYRLAPISGSRVERYLSVPDTPTLAALVDY